jgi:hypothetical protein
VRDLTPDPFKGTWSERPTPDPLEEGTWKGDGLMDFRKLMGQIWPLEAMEMVTIPILSDVECLRDVSWRILVEKAAHILLKI